MYVHVHIHGGRFRITLDGEDISRDCFAASEGRGFACCYARDRAGNFYFVTMPGGRRQIAREMRRGDVRVTPLDDARATYTPAHLRRPLAPNY